MSVLAFKEKVATQSGIPVAQQRLIFRGKVLKDEHLLSEYNMENDDTLHLVERQPQPSPGSSSGEATSSNGNRGHDPAGVLRHRIGPVAHSIVLGTLNVGDPGEAAVPDLSRVIGAVLNSIGINNLSGGLQPGPPPVPDSLSTLVEFMNIMEGALSPNGNQQNQPVAGDSIPTTELPPNSRGLPIVERLHIVLQHAQRLLGEHAIPAISV